MKLDIVKINKAETYSVGVSTPTEFSRAKFEA